jgi:hypothetical protein
MADAGVGRGATIRRTGGPTQGPRNEVDSRLRAGANGSPAAARRAGRRPETPDLEGEPSC